MSVKTRNTIDQHVGARIRMQRMVCGLSQTKLGNAVGITFQQIQKYEKGMNRVGASRLQQIANVLKVAPDFFFGAASAKAVEISGSKEASLLDGFISSRDGIALAKAFARIRNSNMRRSIVSLVQQIAKV
jgi:transcriptional regulator with XRE-family HTH domain